MQPTIDEVREMVQALMAVVGAVERAKRQGRSGNLLVLQTLAARGEARPSDISNELGLHHSSVSRQLQALESSGHVEVVPTPNDGRGTSVRLTDSGRNELLRLSQMSLARFAAYVENWDPVEVRELSRLLTKLETSKIETDKRTSFGVMRWQ